MSLEMIAAKRLAILSGVSYNALYTGRLSNDDFALLPKPRQQMVTNRFDIIADGVTTAQELSVLLRMQKDIDIVFVDYMGILEPAEEDRQKPKYEQMTNISKALKAIAKRGNIPVVALSQLNRESLKNSGKRPSLADLRDTGAIEQDADGVILIHRPGYFNPEDDQDSVELIVAKNRHGELGTVKLAWSGEFTTFTGLDPHHNG
jgi:replicative DNA helicase